MRQHCRDTVTMFSGHTIVGYCIMSFRCGYSIWTPKPLKKIEFFLVLETLLRCRVDVVAKLNNSKVPSSASQCTRNVIKNNNLLISFKKELYQTENLVQTFVFALPKELLKFNLLDLLVLQHYTSNINKIFLEMDLLYSTILVT